MYHVAVGGALPDDPFDATSGTNTDITSRYSYLNIIDAERDFLSGSEGESSWSVTRSERGPVTDNGLRLRSDRSLIDHTRATVAARQATGSTTGEGDGDRPGDEPAADVDYFLVNLRKGDTLAGGFDDLRHVGVIDPDGVQRSGNQLNFSFGYPVESPLRHDRRNSFDHTATVDGVHAVFVTDGIGEYEGELRVVRSGLADERNRAQQTIFLDFDGAEVGADVFGRPADADLSPLSDFLPRWDLGPDRENAVIDATIDAIVETLDHDLRVKDGRNGDRDRTRSGTQFDVEILNSRDHGDRWGDPDVSRVVIGGTQRELEIPTIGVAQSVDPGNTDTEETAVVLLDILSEPAGASAASINTYDVAEGRTKADFVGFVVGHVVAHEIGHLIGNWHQSTFNEIRALMDAGGDFATLAGVGEDGVFGTADDTDPDFVEDIFEPEEGIVGIQDSAGRSVFGLSTGTKRIPRPVDDDSHEHADEEEDGDDEDDD